MSDKDITEYQDEDLLEFKSDDGYSEVPDEGTAEAPKRRGDQDNEEPQAKQGSSDIKVPGTKAGMINAMIQKANNSKTKDLKASYDKIMASMEMQESKDEDDEDDEDEVETEGKKKDVKESIFAITSEDLDLAEGLGVMFEGDELTEEFKEKAMTVFEAAVVSVVNEQLTLVEAQMEAEKAEIEETLDEDFSEKLDGYLDYVVENWMKENELAVEQGLRNELTQDFISGLKGLFSEHYIEVPEDKVDLVDELAEKVAVLEDEVNAQIQENVELRSQFRTVETEKVFAQVVEGLTEVQAEKLEKLSEGIAFESAEEYAEKLAVVKENFFPTEGSVLSESVLDDEEVVITEEEKTVAATGSMAAYIGAISRTAVAK